MGTFEQRPRFYEGQYLSAADLDAVVDYLRAAQGRHALGAHTWGIGIGLNLVERPAPGTPNRREVVLQPGWARDGFARHLVVQLPTRLPESLFAAIGYNPAIDDPALPGGPVGRLVSVWLAYRELGARPPAPGFGACGSEGSTRSDSRIEEQVEFVIGDASLAQQHDPVVIGARRLNARDALRDFDAAAPLLYDGSVPQQSFASADRPPRWLVPVGRVRWVAGEGVLGHFVDRALLPGDRVDAAIRALRRYGGTVTETVEAADQVIVLRRRGDDPQAPHRYAHLLRGSQPLEALLRDLVWVEGGLRAEGDVRLAGSRLVLDNADGDAEANPLYLARAGDGSGLPGQRELRAVIGPEAQADNRFVVGPERTGPPTGQQVPQFVVVSSGRIGINHFDPACELHVRGARAELENTTGTKRLALRTDGAGVDLATATSSLYLRSQGGGNHHVLINPFRPIGDGFVGIGTDQPLHGLDVDEPSVRFKLAPGNGGCLVLQSEPAAAARDKVYLEASDAAAAAPAPELRFSGPSGANLPLLAAYADTTYLRGRLGVNEPQPAADTQLHVRGTRLRLQSADGARSIELRTDGGATDLQSFTSDLYLRATNPGSGAARHIVMNPYAGDGNVGIGTDNPQQKLHVRGDFIRVDGAGDEQAYIGGDASERFVGGVPTRDVQIGSFDAMVREVHFWNRGGGRYMDLRCEDLYESSDAALKQDIAPLAGALESIAALRGVRYTLKDDPSGRPRIGLIAQDVQQVLPEAVSTGRHGAAVAYTRLVPVLVDAVNALRAQVQALQAELQALKAPAAAASPLPSPSPSPSPTPTPTPTRGRRKAPPA